jgi:glycosyltransferase involved in cell wall biosynthesis
MRVSVVIPCHNYGEYLPEAWASVIGQTRPADEIVLVDDGSEDGTWSFIELVAERPNVRALRHPSAEGPARTFNDGIRASTGDLIVKLDADDRLSANYLETLEPVFADSAVSFAYAGERLFGAVEFDRPVRPLVLREFRRENMVNGSAMVRRSAFESAGGFREDFDSIGMEDWELWAHLLELGGKGIPVEGCWLEYRRHANRSRNDISPLTDIRVHLRLARLHPRLFSASAVGTWFVTSAGRKISRPVRRYTRLRRGPSPH